MNDTALLLARLQLAFTVSLIFLVLASGRLATRRRSTLVISRRSCHGNPQGAAGPMARVQAFTRPFASCSSWGEALDKAASAMRPVVMFRFRQSRRRISGERQANGTAEILVMSANSPGATVHAASAWTQNVDRSLFPDRRQRECRRPALRC